MSYGQNFFIKNHTNSSSRTQALLATSDSNYVQAGATNTDDILVYKSNRFGDTLWMNTYGGVQSDEAVDIAEASNGGYVVLGTTESFGAGNADILAIHINEQGDELWSKSYGGVFNDEAYSIVNTSDGGYVITGSGTNVNANAWLMKIDANGVVQWEKTYSGIELSTGRNLIETSDNGFMLIGKDGSNEMKLLRLTSTGDSDWARTASPVWQSEMQGVGIIEMSNGNFVIFGDEQGPRINIFAMGIDPFGNYLWGRTYRQNISSFNSVHDAMETADGGVVLTCRYEMSLGLMKLDNNGVFQWANTYWNVETSSQYYDYRGQMYSNWAGGYLFSSNDESGIVSTDSLGMVPCYGNGTTTLTSIVNNSITTGTSNVTNATSTTTDVTTLESGNYTMSRFEVSNFPNVNAITSPDDCTGSGEISLNITNGLAPYQVDWNTSCSGINCPDLFSGIYPIVITDATGCTVNQSVEVLHQVIPNEICMVTVDPLSQYVQIIWNNPTAGQVEGHSVFRYGSGSPILIGSQDVSIPSILDDLSAILAPNQSSYQYAIAVDDTCGFQSQLSASHKTILCGVAAVTGSTTMLQWNLYEGAAIDYQRIYRDSQGTNNWQLIDSVDANVTTYIDNAFFTDGLYRVEAKFVTPCTTNGLTFEGSYSNYAAVGSVSLDEEFFNVQIAPNPAQNYVDIQLESINGSVTYQVMNTAGQVVQSVESSEQKIRMNVSGLPKGMYYLTVQDDRFQSTKKFVKL
jgi:hypothetical protein